MNTFIEHGVSGVLYALLWAHLYLYGKPSESSLWLQVKREAS
jgi:hypothetical protein